MSWLFKKSKKDEKSTCAECEKEASLTKGFCSDCWKFVQYRPEHGVECSSCGQKMHESLLKGGRCAGCSQDSQSQRPNACKECGKTSLGIHGSKGFCSDCWKFVQYRPEHGIECSSCGQKMHSSLLQGGRCAGCSQIKHHDSKQSDNHEKQSKCAKCGTICKGLNAKGFCSQCAQGHVSSVPCQSCFLRFAVNQGLCKECSDILGTEKSWQAQDGRLYAVGQNGYGQLGSDYPSEVRLSQVRLPADRRVLCVAAGAYHSACITEGGFVWTWGRNSEGQLGRGALTAAVKVPDQVFLGARARILACGDYHTIVGGENNGGWYWGRGVIEPVQLQQEGLVDRHWEMVCCAGGESVVYSTGRTFRWRDPGEVEEVAELNGKRVQQLAGCKWDVVAIVDDGNTFRWAPKETGREDGIARRLEEAEGQIGVVSVAVGRLEGLMATCDGKVLRWTRDPSTGVMIEKPAPLKLDTTVRTVASGHRMSVLLASNCAMLDSAPLCASHQSWTSCAVGAQHALLLCGPQSSLNDPSGDFAALLSAPNPPLSDMMLVCPSLSFPIPCHRLLVHAAGVKLPPPGEPLLIPECSPEAPMLWLVWCYSQRILLTAPTRSLLLPIALSVGPASLLALIQSSASSSFVSEPHHIRLLEASSSVPADSSLVCIDGTIPFHRILFAARSPFYAALFSGRWASDASRKQFQVDSTVSAAQCAIRWCCGEPSPGFTRENVVDVMMLADSMQTQHLEALAESALCDFLREDRDLEAASQLIPIAEQLKRNVLLDMCTRLCGKKK